MNIIAIDPSLTGFAVCLSTSNTTHSFELASKPKSKSLRGRNSRYVKLYSDFMEGVLCFFGLDSSIDLVLIEGYSFASKGSQITLAEFGGFLRSALCKSFSDTPLVEVAPTMLKKFITGKGNANKILVATCAANKFSMTFASDNESDAFALNYIGRCLLGLLSTDTAYQKEVVKLIESSIQDELITRNGEIDGRKDRSRRKSNK